MAYMLKFTKESPMPCASSTLRWLMILIEAFQLTPAIAFAKHQKKNTLHPPTMLIVVTQGRQSEFHLD